MFVAKNGRVSSEEVAVGQGFDCQKHGKSRILRIQTHILRIQTHVLRIQSRKQAHYRAQVTRLPRCKNDVTAARV